MPRKIGATTGTVEGESSLSAWSLMRALTFPSRNEISITGLTSASVRRLCERPPIFRIHCGIVAMVAARSTFATTHCPGRNTIGSSGSITSAFRRCSIID